MARKKETKELNYDLDLGGDLGREQAAARLAEASGSSSAGKPSLPTADYLYGVDSRTVTAAEPTAEPAKEPAAGDAGGSGGTGAGNGGTGGSVSGGSRTDGGTSPAVDTAIGYLQAQVKPTTFTYENAPSYVSRYQDQIDALTQQILGREAFSYDPETDPTYQQYREQYTRNGQRAMQDTLGQIAARTGGLASSYAGTAAQQTYNNYMAELADKVPELRQLAYSMYLDDLNAKRSDLSMLQGLESTDYGRYADQLSQYNVNRNFDYQLGRDAVSDARYADELAYDRARDAISDARYEDELSYERARDAISDARYEDELSYERALQRAQTLAGFGDYSGYSDLGYSDADVASMQTQYALAQLAAQEDETEPEYYDDILKKAQSLSSNNGAGYAVNYLQEMLENGYIDYDQYKTIKGIYVGAGVESEPETYNGIVGYIKGLDLTDAKKKELTDGLMTERDWNYWKTMSSSGGDAGTSVPAAVRDNGSYQEYLLDYYQYLISQQ